MECPKCKHLILRQLVDAYESCFCGWVNNASVGQEWSNFREWSRCLNSNRTNERLEILPRPEVKRKKAAWHRRRTLTTGNPEARGQLVGIIPWWKPLRGRCAHVWTCPDAAQYSRPAVMQICRVCGLLKRADNAQPPPRPGRYTPAEKAVNDIVMDKRNKGRPFKRKKSIDERPAIQVSEGLRDYWGHGDGVRLDRYDMEAQQVTGEA